MDLKKYHKTATICLLSVGLCALGTVIVFWPGCASPKVPLPASPQVEISSLRTEVSDLRSSVDDLAAMNLRLTEENTVLKAMLVDCMSKRMHEK